MSGNEQHLIVFVLHVRDVSIILQLERPYLVSHSFETIIEGILVIVKVVRSTPRIIIRCCIKRECAWKGSKYIGEGRENVGK